MTTSPNPNVQHVVPVGTYQRRDDEVIGGDAPGHDLTVGAVRAAYAAASNKCSHAEDFGKVCDACLPASALILRLYPQAIRPTR